MKSPRLGDVVEIWEKQKKDTLSLKLSQVICTGKNGKEHFRAIRDFDAKITNIKKTRINRILNVDEQRAAIRRLTKKAKEQKNGY